MALGDQLRGLFTNNPVNRVGPTGQPLMGGSNITDLLTRSAGGLLGRDVRSPQEKQAALQEEQRAKLEGLDPNSPEAMQQLIKNLSVTDPARAVQLANSLARQQKADAEAFELKTKKADAQTGQEQIFDILMNAEDINSKDVRNVVSQTAQNYGVMPSTVGALYTSAKKGRKDKAALGNKFTEGSTYTVLDENGAIWNQQIMNPKEEGQEVKEIFIQVGGPPSKTGKPFGERTVTSNVGLTPTQINQAKIDVEVEKEAGKRWIAVQEKASESIEKNVSSLAITDQMINLLQNVESTGGIYNQSLDYLKSQFPSLANQEYVDKQLIVNLAGRKILDNIKALGANPSNAEREFILQLEADINNNPKAVNVAMMYAAKKVLQNQLSRNQYKLSVTRDEYYASLLPGGKNARENSILDYGFVNPLSGEGKGRILTMNEHFNKKNKKPSGNTSKRQTGVQRRQNRED